MDLVPVPPASGPAHAIAPREPLLTRGFVLCFAGNFLHSLGLSLFFHFPGYLHDLGASKVAIGFIFSSMAMAAIAVRPPLGWAMDRRGRRPVILVGSLLHATVCLGYLGVVRISPWVYGVRIGHGLAEAMLFAGYFTFAADLIPSSRRTEGIALFGTSGMLPMALGGLLGDAILAGSDYNRLFLAAAALAAAGLAVSFPLVEPRPEPGGDGSALRGFVPVLAQDDLLPLWFVGTVFSAAIAAVFTFMKTFVVESGVSSLGQFMAAYSVAAVMLRLTLAWLPDRCGPKRVLVPALGLLAAGLSLLARADSAGDVVVAGVLAGLGHGFTFPILSSLVVERARASERGTAMALFTALYDAGMLAGGPGFGTIADLAGYPAMFLTAGGLIVAGAAVFLVWDRRR